MILLPTPEPTFIIAIKIGANSYVFTHTNSLWSVSETVKLAVKYVDSPELNFGHSNFNILCQILIKNTGINLTKLMSGQYGQQYTI